MRTVILGFITLYQKLISPMMPPRCRFYPTCSHYAAESVRVHGAARGGWLSLKRIARCHPLNAGGVDLVPEPGSTSNRHVDNNTLIKGEHTHG